MKLYHIISLALLITAPALPVYIPAMHPANRVHKPTPAEQKAAAMSNTNTVQGLVATFLNPNDTTISWNCFWQKILPTLQQQPKLQQVIPVIKQISNIQVYDDSTVLQLLPITQKIAAAVTPLLPPEVQKIVARYADLGTAIQLINLKLQLNATQKKC